MGAWPSVRCWKKETWAADFTQFARDRLRARPGGVRKTGDWETVDSGEAKRARRQAALIDLVKKSWIACGAVEEGGRRLPINVTSARSRPPSSRQQMLVPVPALWPIYVIIDGGRPLLNLVSDLS